VRDGRLCGIVDWGSACAGDPAVDVQVVWSPLFTADSRRGFLDALGIDDAALARSRGARDQPGLRRSALLPGHLSTDRGAVVAQAGRPWCATLGVRKTSGWGRPLVHDMPPAVEDGPVRSVRSPNRHEEKVTDG
jgi:hypothetical protein